MTRAADLEDTPHRVEIVPGTDAVTRLRSGVAGFGPHNRAKRLRLAETVLHSPSVQDVLSGPKLTIHTHAATCPMGVHDVGRVDPF